MSKLKFFLIALTTLAVQFSYAQNDDYIVSLKGDTVRGSVKYLNYGLEKKVQLTAGGKKNVYSILQTKSFKMDNEIYHTVKTTDSYAFMKPLKSGYLTLYAFQPPKQTNWDGRFMVKKDGGILEVPNLGFRKNMVKFLSNCPEVAEKIESGELTKQLLDMIIETYNNCIENKTTVNLQPQPVVVSANSAWSELENAVKVLDEFEGKSDALEMINDIRSKISRSEKVPNFLLEGLNGSLKDQTTVKDILDKALAEIK